jgi:hypothetical protein
LATFVCALSSAATWWATHAVVGTHEIDRPEFQGLLPPTVKKYRLNVHMLSRPPIFSTVLKQIW